MELYVVQRMLGLLLMVFSLCLLPPAFIGLVYDDEGAVLPFFEAFIVTLVVGCLFWLPVARQPRHELRLRDGFVVVVMFWVLLGLFGAIPLMMAKVPHMHFTDAAFESISGLTTTGATVLTGLDALPHSINFYRHELHWLGGMGIIVLAVAILPMLGVGGMQLYRAETPGPMKDAKLTPRIAETAKALWYIYAGLTLACSLCFWLAGMDVFDAVVHSFSVLSTGGFSSHDASLGYFNSPLVDAIAVVFMVLAGANFALHFIAWRSMSLAAYRGDSELKSYLIALCLIASLTVGYLYSVGTFPSLAQAFHHGVFQVVSIGTSTGLLTTGYSDWPGFLPVLLLFSSFICGCAGSTAGGLKMIRFVLLLKQGRREITRLIHPASINIIKINGRALPARVMQAVWGFFSVYVAVFLVLMLALMFVGLDHVTAFSAMVACINNMGVGLGAVSTSFASINDAAKWILSLAMIMGRLEIFALLVLFTPAFWQR